MDAHRPTAWRRTHLSHRLSFATEQLNARFSLPLWISFSLAHPANHFNQAQSTSKQNRYLFAWEASVALLSIALISSLLCPFRTFRE